MSGKKHHNTTSKNEHATLLSDLNVPNRFRVQQRAKYSSLQLRAVCITGTKCLQHYFKCIRQSPTTEDTNFRCHQCSFLQTTNRMNSNKSMWTATASFLNGFLTPALFKTSSRFFRTTGVCFDAKK